MGPKLDQLINSSSSSPAQKQAAKQIRHELSKKVPLATDPKAGIIEKARETARNVQSVHDQLNSELARFRRFRDTDLQLRLNDSPGNESAIRQDVERKFSSQENQIRDDAEAQYRKCCASDALRIREDLMLKCPGISTYDFKTSYELDFAPGIPNRRNLSEYRTIAQDLNKLADAYEKGCSMR